MKQQDMTKGSIWRGFLLFAIPLFLGSFFQQLYGTVDMMFVGNYLGKNAAAAVGASSILVTCMIGLFTGISVGAGVITAQAYGAKEEQKVKKCMMNAILLGLFGGMILTVAGLMFSKYFLKILNTPESVMENALLYIHLYLLSIPGMILYNMSAGILRAAGDSKTPFLVLAAGGILNVAADYLFIARLGLGIAGAAWATVLSQTFTAVVLVVLVVRKERLWKQSWLPDVNILQQIIIIGVPLGIQAMVLTLSNIFVQYYINGFGEDAVAAFAVYFKAENFIYMPIMALGQSMVTFTGQNIGAGKYDRVRKGAVTCNVISVGIIAGLSICFLTGGRQLLGLFCKDEAVMILGLQILYTTFPVYFIYAIMEVTGSIIRGAGKSLQSMIVVMLTLCVLRVVILRFMVQKFHTVQSVALVYPITWMLAALCFVVCYERLQKKWTKVEKRTPRVACGETENPVS